jgi:hypothetical protein
MPVFTISGAGTSTNFGGFELGTTVFRFAKFATRESNRTSTW